MSEPVAKDRPTVDLDDFERRLRQRDREQEDPLAELARLVGETSDPYDEVFARERVAFDDDRQAQQRHLDPRYLDRSQPEQRYVTDRYGQAPALRDESSLERHQAYARSETYGHDSPFQDRGHEPDQGQRQDPRGGAAGLAGDFASIEAGLRGTIPAVSQHDAYASDHEYYAQNELYAQHEQAEHGHSAQAHDADAWPEPVAKDAPRSRRSIYAMVATIAIGVIGVGVAFAYKGSSSSPSAIKTIAAVPGPTKIQPPADSAADASASGQDSAMLNKGGQQASPTRLVNGEEQPVDIGQAVQENASRTADVGGTAPGDASSVPVPPAPGQSANPTDNGQQSGANPHTDPLPSFGLSEMPPPKKVKVVSVRPDGTILPTDAAPTIDPTKSADPAPVAKTSTPKSGTPKSTSRVSAKPVQTASTDADGATPTPKPAHKAKPKKVAALEQPTDTANAPDQAAAPASSGGFAVQLAAPGSEAEAKSATSRLAKKFADALDGRHLGVHKAQSNGKSVFRVRVSSLSKDDAVGLCEKLKAAGGSCFVAKN